MRNVKINALDTNPLLKGLMKKAELETEPKRIWEDLDVLYETIGNGIIELAGSVASTSQTLVGQEFSTVKETTTAIGGLSKDLVAMAETLATIHDRHKEHHGVIANEAETELAIDCFQDYHELSTRFTQLTMQPMLTITEALSEIGQQRKEEEAGIKFTETGDIEGSATVIKEGNENV